MLVPIVANPASKVPPRVEFATAKLPLYNPCELEYGVALRLTFPISSHKGPTAGNVIVGFAFTSILPLIVPVQPFNVKLYETEILPFPATDGVNIVPLTPLPVIVPPDGVKFADMSFAVISLAQ